ncbi:MAG: DUF4397 domain-containing protein [Jatrophihabitantaceae bacterium]
MRRLISMFGIVLAACAAMLLGGVPAHADTMASVSVVHGIPNTPVNVFVNGKSTLANFKPGTVAGPLQLPAGTYKVTIFPAANTAGTGTPVISASATVTAGANVTLVAHLSAAGKPTLTPFVNDTSTVAAGQARLVVRHTAAAPAVDVRADGKVAFKALTNPKQAMADLPAGSISADVVLAGTSTVAIGPATLNLAEGSDTIVYAIGSASAKSLALVVQTIDGLGSAPGGMPAGSGGFASPDNGIPTGAWLASGIGAALALAAGLRLAQLRTGR